VGATHNEDMSGGSRRERDPGVGYGSSARTGADSVRGMLQYRYNGGALGPEIDVKAGVASAGSG
jgi:hypothetical protein